MCYMCWTANILIGVKCCPKQELCATRQYWQCHSGGSVWSIWKTGRAEEAKPRTFGSCVFQLCKVSLSLQSSLQWHGVGNLFRYSGTFKYFRSSCWCGLSWVKTKPCVSQQSHHNLAVDSWRCWNKSRWQDVRGQVFPIRSHPQRQRIHAAIPLWSVLFVLEAKRAGMPQHCLDFGMHCSETSSEDW